MQKQQSTHVPIHVTMHPQTPHKHICTCTCNHTYKNWKTNIHQWLHQKPWFLFLPLLTRSTGLNQIHFLTSIPHLYSVSVVQRSHHCSPKGVCSLPAQDICASIPECSASPSIIQVTPSNGCPWLIISQILFVFLSPGIDPRSFSSVVDLLSLCFQWLTPVFHEQY